MQNANNINPAAKELFNNIAKAVSVKRQRAAIKSITKKGDLSYFPALPGAIAPYIDKSKSQINVVMLSANENDVIDYGRWFALLPYMLGTPDMSVNIVIVPNTNVLNKPTGYRKLIDYLADEDLSGAFTSSLVKASLAEIVSELGEDNIDVVFNNNAAYEDFDTQEDLDALASLIKHGTSYVLADMSPFTLFLRAVMYQSMGFTSNVDVQKNPYFLPLKKGISHTHRHAGYTLAFTDVQSPTLLSSTDKANIEMLAKHLADCVNIGEPLQRLPHLNETGCWQILEAFSIDPKTDIATCSHSGDVITLRMKGLTYPTFTHPDTWNDKCESLVWGITAYHMYREQLSQAKAKMSA